jgi:hypothetical protein
MNYYQAIEGHIYRSNAPHSMLDEKLSKAAGEAGYRKAAGIRLRKILKPGKTVYTTLRHCSRSGALRHISLHAVHKADLISLDEDAALVTGRKLANGGGIVVGGGGMDMGFALVYSLGRHLWPKGTPKPHGRRNGVPDSDGGYALKQEWT